MLTSVSSRAVQWLAGWPLWLALLLLVGGLLRLTGYNFGLPYIDHPDEPQFSLAARMIIDNGSARPMLLDGYPPGLINVSYVLQRFVLDPTAPPAIVIPYLRLLSIAASLGTGLLIALIGRRVASPLAGLIGAAIWLFEPLLVQHSRYAVPNMFVAFLALLSVYQMLTAARCKRPGWATAALFSWMLAVLFKYQAVFILPALLAIWLTRLWEVDADRRAIGVHLGKLIFVAALFLAWWVLLTPLLQANDIPYFIAPTESLGIPTPAVLWSNLVGAVGSIWLPTLWLPGLIAAAVAARQRSIWGLGVAGVALSAVCWFIGVSLFQAQGFAQFIGFDALVIALVGVGLAFLADVMAAGLRSRLSLFSHGVTRAAIAAAVCGLALLPGALRAVENARYATLPDRRNDLAQWIDVSLPSGRYIAGEDNHKTFNRNWGGYTGVNDFPLATQAALSSQPLEAWREQGVDYAILDYHEFQALAGQPQLDELTPLKIYPPDPAYRGPSFAVVRLWPMTQRIDAEPLGSVRLIGMDLPDAEMQPGQTLEFRLYWQAAAPTDGVYTVFNHLLDADGTLIAQVDQSPHADPRRTTADWDDPTETLMSGLFTLALPAELPPGTYRLISGFYRAVDGARLTGAEGAESWPLAEIAVTAP